MTEVSPIDLTGELPETEICAECARSGSLHRATQTKVVYCPHRLRGAYAAKGRPWKIVSGIERHHFRDLVALGLNLGELRIDLARDLSHIVQQQASSATKH